MTNEPPTEISLVSELPGVSCGLANTVTNQDANPILKRSPRQGMGDRMEPDEAAPRVVFSG